MEDLLSFLMGVIGNIISVLVFLSPLKTFWRIVKQRSTEEFESVPYICSLLCSSLWAYYALTKSGELLVATINGFGIVVETTYLILFLIFSPRRMRMKTGILVGILDVGILAAAIGVTKMTLQGEKRTEALGFICAALNILMYAAPLSAMKTVVTTKSVEYMPFLLSFFLSINGGVWTFYSLLLPDYFLMVPNGAGFVLGVVQLVLYAIYRNPKSLKKNNVSDAGLVEEPLISSYSITAPDHS
ncbi:bidirectional sugar transporter SWEET17 isoform X1 [Malania oleifera]|uniref:bidirectional sugar transporter SWEET17 isoform X1 n=1 Tax=Malania oleifera TaxID=397392 RepID=UPI0025AEA2E0|nr:bidirectional sugar transporter SWEET17 isoform X1 [Malania oleifera]